MAVVAHKSRAACVPRAGVVRAAAVQCENARRGCRCSCSMYAMHSATFAGGNSSGLAGEGGLSVCLGSAVKARVGIVVER